MRVPVLMYHELIMDKQNREAYAVMSEAFARQLEFLADNGFRGVAIKDMVGSYKSNSEKRVVITFDDGNYSDYAIAYPALKRYGFTATFFITSGFVEQENRLSWDNIREMSCNGMDIQSHGVTHKFLPNLKGGELYEELGRSKEMIEKEINKPVSFLSLPGGFYSKVVVKAARETGYRGVCNSVPGLNESSKFQEDFFLLKRFVITRKKTFADYKKIVEKAWLHIMASQIENHLKTAAKRVLGIDRYYWIWAKYSKNA